MAKNNFHVESLDKGFIITHNGKRSAVANVDTVEDIIISKLKEMFRFHCAGVRSAYVSLDFEENPPKQAKSN